MMEKTYVLRNKSTNKIIFSFKCESLKICVEAAVIFGADLSKADLSNANLSDANLSYADLSDANLSDANLSYADLSDAYMSNANLSDANLSYSDLSDAYMSNANLSDANLSYADLSNADLSNAYLYKADLYNAKNIISIQWRGFSFYIQKEKTKIGCEYRTNTEWMNVDKEVAVELGIDGDDYESYRDIIKVGVSILGG